VSELRNLPPSAAVSIGKSGTPAGLYLGYVSVGAYGSANRATVAELRLANRLTAYLHTVVVGESSDGAVVGNSCTGILDIAAADVQIGNQSGKITGVNDLHSSWGTAPPIVGAATERST
jgi:hypothetical protein